ncbi:hypothetical protein TrRE_jg2202, partial [Triparma retinervis]
MASLRSPMRELDINLPSRSEQLSILKLVQQIEREEEADRKKRMKEEEKEGEEAAQRLVMEIEGEELARKIVDEEAREHAREVEKKLAVVHGEWKSTRKAWREAKFFPTRVGGGVKLQVKLKDMLTCECVCDAKRNVLNVTAVAKEPTVPVHLHTVVGEVGWKEIKFRCDLSFQGDGVRWEEMEVRQEREGDTLNVFVTRR